MTRMTRPGFNAGSTIRDQARLRALSHSSGTSSGWLKALPQPALDLAIPPHDCTIALRLWLGIPLFPSLPLCTSLSVRIDQFGDHLLGCSHGPLRIQRHNALVSVVHHALLQDHPGVVSRGQTAFSSSRRLSIRDYKRLLLIDKRRDEEKAVWPRETIDIRVH